mmetsp:Transcript_26347/g.43972  ORF Transcript_26347/g.43972 Transcript_26347/m.43972 type:complete len:306 (-) Transcript_26347:1688-2605(-)
MRVLRAKLVRKHLRLYRILFEIAPPDYHVLLDGNFIFTAIKLKIDLRDRLEKLLQGVSVKIYILQSALQELELVGEKALKAKEFAKKFCEIIDDINLVTGENASERLVAFIDENAKRNTKLATVSTSTSTGSILGRYRYFVATQDQEMRRKLAMTPGVPLIYLNQVTLVLESPSRSTIQYSQQMEQAKQALNAEESSMMHTLTSSSSSGGGSSLGDGTNKRKREADELHSATTGINNTASTSGATSSMSKVQRIATALAPGTAVDTRNKKFKKKAKGPNPLANAKASEDSSNSKKKKQRKYRKFY